MTDLLTRGVDKRLQELDKEFEAKVNEMILQEGNMPLGANRNAQTSATPTTGNEASELDAILESRKHTRESEQQSEELAQLYEENAEGLDKIKDNIAKNTQPVFTGMMDIFQQAASFASGVERFKQVLDQLNIHDVESDSVRVKKITDSLIEVRTIMLLIQTLTGGAYTEELKQLELSLYQDLVRSLFQLTPKDNLSHLAKELQNTIKENTHNFTQVMQKFTTKQQEFLHSLTKKSKT